LGNYLQICGLTSDYSIFEDILAKVRSSPSVRAIDKAEIFSIGYNAELIWRMDTHDWDGVSAMIPDLQAGLKANEGMISQGLVLAFQYHIFIFYFLGEDYAACHTWQRAITEAPRTEQRMDLQRLVRVMGLLLIWHKGDFDLLEYELRSVTRNLENWGGGKLEQYVLDLVQSLLHARDDHSQKAALEQFQQLVSASAMEGILGSSVLKAWVAGQLTGESPRKVIKTA
jgi:hypothetical protein